MAYGTNNRMTDIYIVIGLFFAGLIAGFINTLAGGGSVLTLPALMLAGLPPADANATNRIGVLFQSLSGSVRFQQKKMIPADELFRTVPAMVTGGLTGALAAVYIPERIFEPLMYSLLIAAALLTFIKQDNTDSNIPHVPKWKRYTALFATGFYGGFIQAGVGYILLWSLHAVSGLPFKKANALKVVLVLPFTIVSILVFFMHDLVRIIPGSLLALGGIFGAFMGVSFVDRVSVLKIKIFMLVLLLGVISLKFVLQAGGNWTDGMDNFVNAQDLQINACQNCR